MADEQCSLEELAAFLDEDSNGSFTESEKPNENDENDGVGPACRPNDEGSEEEFEPAAIAAFLHESDLEEEEEDVANNTSNLPIAAAAGSGDGDSNTDTSPQALQAELQAMQKRMLELQNMLSQKSPPTSQTYLLDESKDHNPFFPSDANEKHKKLPVCTQAIVPKTTSTPKSDTVQSKISTKSSSKTKQQADRAAMRREMFGESDSDMDSDGDSRSLSEQGKQLQQMIDHVDSGTKHRTAHTPKPTSEVVKKQSIDWRSKSVATRDNIMRSSLPSSSSTLNTSKQEEKYIVDPSTGIRIVKPLISSGELASKMKDRKVLKLSRLHTKVNTPDMQGDWVTVGVVVQKTEPKQSSNGKTFCIWKLADLDNNDQVVSFFLFGQTYKEHWKNDKGSVIGLLNPSIMDNAEKSNKEIAFTINNPKQLLLIGRSKDLGWCTGLTKKGNICNNFINKKYGDFCSYHVQSAYRKTSSGRTELQGSITGVTPKNYQRKMLPKKGSHFFYGGQTFSSLPTMKGGANKKNDITIKKLQVEQRMTKNKVTTMSLHEVKACDADAIKQAPVKETDQAFMEMISTPTVGSLNLVKHLIKKEDTVSVCSKDKQQQVIRSVTPKELIQQHKKEMQDRRKARAARPATPINTKPSLGKPLNNHDNRDNIFFDISPTRKLFSPPKNISLEIAKRKAIEKIQNKGGLSREDPNAVKKVANHDKVKKRVLETSGSSADECSQPPKKRSRLLGNVEINSPEFQKMFKAKSSHKGALAEAEAEREEEYFTVLEKKEMMEEKMQAVTKLEVWVVTCKLCNYTAFSASETCKKENHQPHKHKAVKRFFKCKNCTNRTISLDKYPKEACKNCGSSSFERTSMAREKTGPKLESETLCLRGNEEKFLSSMSGKVYLSLP